MFKSERTLAFIHQIPPRPIRSKFPNYWFSLKLFTPLFFPEISDQKLAVRTSYWERWNSLCSPPQPLLNLTIIHKQNMKITTQTIQSPGVSSLIDQPVTSTNSELRVPYQIRNDYWKANFQGFNCITNRGNTYCIIFSLKIWTFWNQMKVELTCKWFWWHWFQRASPVIDSKSELARVCKAASDDYRETKNYKSNYSSNHSSNNKGSYQKTASTYK